MTTYDIDFSGYVPEWGTVTITAPDVETAKYEALKEIEASYPEYVDVEITNVLEIKD